MNWRGSSQMAQELFCEGEEVLYWVPQALQIRRSSEVQRVGIEDILVVWNVSPYKYADGYAKSRIYTKYALFSGLEQVGVYPLNGSNPVSRCGETKNVVVLNE